MNTLSFQRRCIPFLCCGRTCKCRACAGDFLQVWPQKWPKPAFLLPYLREMWFTEPLCASTARNARCGGGMGLCGDEDCSGKNRFARAYVMQGYFVGLKCVNHVAHKKRHHIFAVS